MSAPKSLKMSGLSKVPVRAELSVDEATALSAISEENRQIIAILRALGDNVRLGIVRKLMREKRKLRSEEIVACSSVAVHSQPCMSYHFAKLVKAGVVLEEKRGTEKVYTLNVSHLRKLGIDVNKL